MDYTTTKLLTLLNVSAIKAGKRKWTEESTPAQKLNKRKSARIAQADADESSISANGDDTQDTSGSEDVQANGNADEALEGDEVDTGDDTADPYERHFGPASAPLTEPARVSVDQGVWTTSKQKLGKLGAVIHSSPQHYVPAPGGKKNAILERLRTPFVERQKKLPQVQRELQDDILGALSTHQDLFITHAALDTQPATREAIALHFFNHITKKRRRVLKNNERITHHSKTHPHSPPPEDVQDQGFTRPSVLLLLPFRNSAERWIGALTSHTPTPGYQVEHRARFAQEYGLPPGAEDKLASAPLGTYPADHVETFKGNVDDSFRIGVKMTRKTIKLFAEFYGCDLIVASPLGLRLAIEKEKSADFLSSIEILVIDQLDALTMQNWEHVQFVMSHLNQIPKESHDADFSRIKPWYLDGHAAYLRQSIFLSAYETPEMRSLFSKSLKNVAGKIRTERRWVPVGVPDGIEQDFVQFDCASPKDEVEKRFQYFTTQLLPQVLKSAVQSSNTLVFVPSSFDFIRVQNHFRKNVSASYTVLSEYSTNQDISRARHAFFSGKKQFLLVSERFHFFRRYKLRGIRNIIFYAPPEHAVFYAELLAAPFLDDGVEPNDVSVKVLYSRLDWMRLERIAGTEGARGLVSQGA